jgi:hypothetical protein
MELCELLRERHERIYRTSHSDDLTLSKVPHGKFAVRFRPTCGLRRACRAYLYSIRQRRQLSWQLPVEELFLASQAARYSVK